MAETSRLPLLIYVLAAGTFLMLTTEFVVAGILPEIATDLGIAVSAGGLLITVFAVGMVVGAPVMAVATRSLPHRTTLLLALGVFVAGHVVVALSSDLAVLLVARFVTAVATGAFWAVAAVVASRAGGPGLASRAVGVVNAGGMLATVLGVPLGAYAAQLLGWRGTFWALAVLALAAMPLIAAQVPGTRAGSEGSVLHELSALRSGRLWLALAAAATTTGGVLAAYSYIAPLLTERTGLAAGVVPLVLAGFGIGSLVGSLIGGRLGDTHPHVTTVVAPVATTALLVLLGLLSGAAVPTVVLLVLLGLFGLGANPVLISLAVRYATHAPTIGSALAVAAFNLGTAFSSWAGARALETDLGVVGPVAVGAVIAAITVVPAAALLLLQRRTSTTTTAEASGSAPVGIAV